MSWNPDTGEDLAAGAISVTSVEATSMACWYEFLTGWFDGGYHLVRTTATAKCPAVQKVIFQDMPTPQIDGVVIHVVSAEVPSELKRRQWTEGRWMVSEDRELSFLIRSRVKTRRADGRNSVAMAQWTADILFSVLTGINTTQALQRRGMGVFRANPGVLISAGDIAMRTVNLTCRYFYNCEAEPDAMPGYRIVNGDLQFFNPTTRNWDEVSAVGAVPQLAVDPDPQPKVRLISGYLQLWNAVTEKWHTVRVSGDPAQLQIDQEGSNETPADAVPLAYRDKNGVLQLLNSTTGLFHSLTVSGAIPQLSITETGEA